MTDGPENYSKNLDVCPDQLRAAFLASEKWLKKIRQLRNRGQFTDQQVELARLAFEIYRRQVAIMTPINDIPVIRQPVVGTD